MIASSVTGGEKLARVFRRVFKEIKPGVRLIDLERMADELIKKEGGYPSFKTVKNYQWATCVNINQGVVHGIPTDYVIKEGDLVSLDIGMLYQGRHTDMAWTKIANSESLTVNSKFLETGKEALRRAIAVAKPGNRVGNISQVIEETISRAGYFVVKDLTGHCVGKQLHQEPMIPQFLNRKIENTPLLTAGMHLVIEVIYTEKPTEIRIKNDGWTVETVSGCLAALFEETTSLIKGGNLVLTPIESERGIW